MKKRQETSEYRHDTLTTPTDIREPDPEELREILEAIGQSGEDVPGEAEGRGSETVMSQDCVREYLRSIGNIKLLTAEEERELAIRIENGDEEARDKMIRSNLRLVIAVVKGYSGRGLSLEDLIQEGNLGLMKAVEKFDYRKGFRFSTYATWWIRQAVSRALADQARTIRLPVHMSESIFRVNRAYSVLKQELGRDPSVEEIAESCGLTVDRVEEAIRNARATVSINSVVGDDEDSEVGDFLYDRTAETPQEIAEKSELHEIMAELLELLPSRDRRIIELRFGLDGGDPMTLEEVGEVFGITRERVRQIEAKALRRLSHSAAVKKLIDYRCA